MYLSGSCRVTEGRSGGEFRASQKLRWESAVQVSDRESALHVQSLNLWHQEGKYDPIGITEGWWDKMQEYST